MEPLKQVLSLLIGDEFMQLTGKFAGLLSFIDTCLNIGKQGGAALRLIQDGALGKLVQKPPWVCVGKLPLVEILKRNIGVFGKGMPHQGGLAGLAWTRNDNHWIVAGVVFESGFRVAGDVGHGGFWLLYVSTLCGGNG